MRNRSGHPLHDGGVVGMLSVMLMKRADAQIPLLFVGCLFLLDTFRVLLGCSRVSETDLAVLASVSGFQERCPQIPFQVVTKLKREELLALKMLARFYVPLPTSSLSRCTTQGSEPLQSKPHLPRCALGNTRLSIGHPNPRSSSKYQNSKIHDWRQSKQNDWLRCDRRRLR